MWKACSLAKMIMLHISNQHNCSVNMTRYDMTYFVEFRSPISATTVVVVPLLTGSFFTTSFFFTSMSLPVCKKIHVKVVVLLLYKVVRFFLSVA